MLLILWSKTFDDGNGVIDRRLTDVDGLETTLERRILFDVLTVFIYRRRTDALQLSAGEGWLQEIGCIQRSLSGSCTNDGMEFINKQNDLSCSIPDSVHDAL